MRSEADVSWALYAAVAFGRGGLGILTIWLVVLIVMSIQGAEMKAAIKKAVSVLKRAESIEDYLEKVI
jgi:hypothetical protein